MNLLRRSLAATASVAMTKKAWVAHAPGATRF